MPANPLNSWEIPILIHPYFGKIYKELWGTFRVTQQSIDRVVSLVFIGVAPKGGDFLDYGKATGDIQGDSLKECGVATHL